MNVRGRIEGNREARLGLRSTPVICWQSRNREAAPDLVISTSRDDSLCSEPENQYKSRLLERESDKWEPALPKPYEDLFPKIQHESKARHHALMALLSLLAQYCDLLMCVHVCNKPLLSRSVDVSKGGRTRHQPILVLCHRENRGKGGKALCPLPLNRPLLSTLPALSSSWPFPFVCLSGDNGRLSVTQGLTQIYSVRRRTASGEMGISQPFAHGSHPPQSEPLASQMRFCSREKSQGRSLACIFCLFDYREKVKWGPLRHG